MSAERLLGPIDVGLDHECGTPAHYPCPPAPDWLIIGGKVGQVPGR